MTLTEAIDAYIALKRSLGAVFAADARILRAFARALGDIPVRDIDPETTRAFCRGEGAPTRWWERKDETLRGFFAWLVGRGHLCACPLPAHRRASGVPSSPTYTPATNCNAFSMRRRS